MYTCKVMMIESKMENGNFDCCTMKPDIHLPRYICINGYYRNCIMYINVAHFLI